MTDDSPLRFAHLLRQLRRAAGLTQEELAQRARLGARSVSDLERGISTAPRRDTVSLLADALRLDGGTRADFSAAAQAGRAELMASRPDAGAGPHHLPTLPASLIGRDAECAAVHDLLIAPDARIVTLTGSPGIGKTSLAVQVATGLLKQFPQGVVFVALATISDPGQVKAAIARRLGVADNRDRPIGLALADHLRARRTLLVLDNFEQLLAAAPDLGDLITECPRLSILVTSRAILNLRGEHEFAVAPLAVPEAGPADAGAADRYPAVRLFVERAAAVQPGFVLTDETAPAVVAICRRLDGVPLAIELAAARTRLLTPSQLLARLGRSLSVLVGGPQDLPERQRTLRAAIAWSYDLLDEPSQELFRRLAVFEGGWSLDAAEATCGPGRDVLAGLTSLVEKSLVQRQPDVGGASRFQLLETLREFGGERLAEHGEARAQRVAHAAYFERLAIESEVALQGPDLAEWLVRMELDHDNLREALRWLRDTEEIDAGLRMAGALWRFWEHHGHLAEARAFLEALLALDDNRGGAVEERASVESGRLQARADALHAAGTMALRMGDYKRCVAAMSECLVLRRRLGDVPGAVVALNGLANAAVYQGEFGRAATHYREALELARGVGRQRHIAALLGNLAFVATERGEYAHAEALAVESLALRRALGDAASIGTALNSLGDIHQRQGLFASAEEFLHEAVAIFRQLGSPVATGYAVLTIAEVAAHQDDAVRAADLSGESLELFRGAGDRRGCGMALHLVGDMARVRGDFDRALACLDECLALFAATTDRLGIVRVLEARARLALAQRDRDWAARLFGLATGLRAVLEVPVWAIERAKHDQDIASLSDSMPIFEAARALRPAPPMQPDPVDVPALLPATAAVPRESA